MLILWKTKWNATYQKMIARGFKHILLNVLKIPTYSIMLIFLTQEKKKKKVKVSLTMMNMPNLVVKLLS